MIKIILALLLLVSASFSAEAPFGFKWGQKISTSKCIELKEVGQGTYVCKMKNVPKPIQKLDFVYLVLWDGALVKISAFMKDINGDPYGNLGLEDYENMKAVLTKKYGEPSNAIDIIGRELYQEPSEFYQCLKYDGCGMYITIWGDSSSDQVALSLEGLRRGSGFLKLVYESSLFKKATSALEQNEDKEAGENL